MALKDQKIYLSIGVVFIFTIVLHFFRVLRPIEDGVRNITVPILGRVHGISINVGNNYQFFKNRSDFIAAYEECSAGAQKNDILISNVKMLTDENIELKKQLHYFDKKTINHVLANVVGREILSTEQSVIIDRGAKDGISIDDPVIVQDGILVGKVAKVNDTISVVRLLNDNTSRVGATILNKDKSLGVVEGGFGISLKMSLIPRDETILVGDQIVASGLETSTPRGLLVGSVAEIENEPYKPFQQAIITPATDLSKLTVVSVLLTK